MMLKSSDKVMQNDSESKVNPVAIKVITATIVFLKLFVCETLAKRIIAIVLLSVSVPNNAVSELTGLCDKSVRVLRKAVLSGEISGLFHVGGGGRPQKLRDVESAIAEEISTNDYHSQQQIVDMILEKFGIKVSLQAVRSLLKKTNQAVKMRVSSSEG